MKHATIQTLIKSNLRTYINIDKNDSLSPGTGLTLWTKSNDTILGSSFLGEKGITSEEVGKNAASDLLKEIQANANLDVYSFDQILPYLVLTRNNEKIFFIVREISNHAKTNIWLLQKFFNVNFEIKQNNINYYIYLS
jgi:RNA 3'-terminal phosphate cyclase